MSQAESGLSEAAMSQGRLWSVRSRDWAELQEVMMQPAQEAVLDAIGLQEGTRLLDVGCGAGGAARIAREHGASVSGVDAADGMLEIARERVPDGDFRVGDLLDLPWAEDSFDAVVGFNSFQYAADPVAALREARRVAKPGGWVGIVVWGAAEECDAAAQFKALGALMPPPPPGAPGPLAGEQRIAAWAAEAGLEVRSDQRVDCPWAYPDLSTALRAMASAGPVVGIAQQVGEQAVEEALTACLENFAAAGGGYRFHNKFRALTATA